jgi:hypothetical protein
MEATRAETVRQFLEELGQHLHEYLRLDIGGCIPLILLGYLSRRTDDIDVVNEVPAELRAQHKLLEELARRYALALTHFQSHYLPKGWQQRLHSQGNFGRLNVYLVDPLDVFLSKLFSAREKDRDDLRILIRQFDKDTIIRRMRDTCGDLIVAAGLREKAENNWKILYGEPLPS